MTETCTQSFSPPDCSSVLPCCSSFSQEFEVHDECLGVVPDDARARDCSAGALRAGVAAARAAAHVIANSDSSIPELCELLAKIDERVSACAQQVEGLMPWWSDLQREVAEKKEQLRRAAQQTIDALAAGLRGKLREVRESHAAGRHGEGVEGVLAREPLLAGCGSRDGVDLLGADAGPE